MDFVKRNVFWIGMGALVLFSGVVFAVWGLPARGRNSKSASDLTGEAKRVETIAGRPSVRTQGDITQEKQKRESFETQWAQTLAMFQQRDEFIERRFTDPDDPTRQVDDMDAGTWKKAYRQNMDELATKVADSFVLTGGQPIVQKDYREVWPDVPEVQRETKRYWIQYYIVSAIAGLNKAGAKPAVPVFEVFRFSAQPDRLLDATHETVFKPVAFDMQFSCEFQSVPMVLARLRDSRELSVYITSMVLNRGQVASAGGGGGGVFGRGASPAMPGAFGDPMAGMDPFAMSEMAGRRPGGVRPGVGVPGVRQPGTVGRVAQETEVLPSTLVTVLIRGYVADYVGEQEDEGQELGFAE